MKQSEATPATTTRPQGTRPQGTRPQGIPSIIGSDLKVTGNIESAGDLQIEGRIEGDVKSLTLHIGEGAAVKGSVSADRITIAGSVDGQVRANAVNVRKSAHIVGDVIHQNLSIEAGAYLEGRLSRIETDESLGPTLVLEMPAQEADADSDRSEREKQRAAASEMASALLENRTAPA